MNEDEIKKVLGGEGWDALNKAPQLNAEDQKKKAEEEYEKAQKFHACFSTPAGAWVLNHLREETECKPAFAPGGAYPIEYQGCVREGQNSIYRRIKQLMDLAEKGPPHLKEK